MAGAGEKLERQFAVWLDVEGAVAVGFGRSALRLSLEALDVRSRDVLVPNFICAQVPEAVERVGGRPVFYPVRRDLSVSAAEFRAAFTPATRAAVVVHYFGYVLPEVVQLGEICRERGVSVIEDCALAMGAQSGGGRAGTFGDVAIFSFTKSDWCYGGGLAASDSPELLERMRALRVEKFRWANKLSASYGLLRRADFVANRPNLSRVAEGAGKWLQRIFGLREGNFYDAGRFDAPMPAFSARRALRLLKTLPAVTARRQRLLNQFTRALASTAHILVRPNPHPGDAAAFLLVQSPAGQAEHWVDQAARAGVTLRLTWPAYQSLRAGQASEELKWLGRHLVVLEVHPRLTPSEVERIVLVFKKLAQL